MCLYVSCLALVRGLCEVMCLYDVMCLYVSGFALVPGLCVLYRYYRYYTFLMFGHFWLMMYFEVYTSSAIRRTEAKLCNLWM